MSSSSYPFSDDIDTSELFVLAFIYSVIAFLIVCPPSELITAGFSLQNIFSRILVESEETAFIRYHIKRISLKIFIHSLLPLGYVCLLLYFCDWSLGIFNAFTALLTTTSIFLQIVIIFCFLTPCFVAGIVFKWHLNDCFMHPIVRQLRLFVQSNDQQQSQTWHTVESSINTEFRRFDKFMCGSTTSSIRCYVLDSWILQCTMYNVNIAQQSNVHVELVAAHDVHLQETNEQATLSMQYLNILIKSGDIRINPFLIRLKASEYDDLRGKLQAHIANMKNIVVRQSLSDLFLEDFRRHIQRNPKYRLPLNQPELETCIGCLQMNANVKLVKRCEALEVGQCRACFCRPMWCLECLGKWFASRQDQTRPETWLQSTSPCPTCRSVFCMLDISLIDF